MASRSQDGERVCFLHVGAPKTGSTAIQHFLVNNHVALAQFGAHYSLAGRCSWRPGHHEFSAQLRAEADVDTRVGAIASVVDEIRAEDARTAIVSAEDLVIADQGRFPAVRDAFEAIGYRVKVVLYARAHADYVESIYCEAVKHGLRQPFARFLDDVIERGLVSQPGVSLPVAFSTLAERFATCFGSDAIIVRGYRRYGEPVSLVRDFMSAIGVDTTRDDGSFVWPSRYDNPRLPTADVARLVGGVGTEKRIELAGRAGEEPFAPLTADERLRITDRFDGDAALLVERWGVDPQTFHSIVHAESESTWRARELFHAVNAE